MAEIIVVVDGAPWKNDYGDLFFRDKDGKEHKIAQKREAQHAAIISGQAVILDYKVYQGHDYISTAKPVAGALPAVPPDAAPGVTPTPISTTRRIDPQERGMWMKEVGEWLRQGKLEELYPNTHKAIRIKYQHSLLEGIDVEIVSE